MIEELASAISGLLAADVDCLSADCLQESVVEFRKLTSVLAAAEARFVDQWDAEMVWAGDGSRSAGNRLARDAHCSPAVASAVVKRTRRLRTMPITAAASRLVGSPSITSTC